MAKLEREMTVLLEMKHSPIMREFVQRIVRETLRQSHDLDLIRNSDYSDELAKELEGKVIKIEGSTLSTYNAKVSFADTGEEVPGIRRVEIELDAQTDTMVATLYRWRHNGPHEPTLEHASTNKVEVSTLARVEGVTHAE